MHILWQFVDVFILYSCRPLFSLRKLPSCALAVVLDSCTLGYLPSNLCDVSMRKRIHVVHNFFGSDIRHVLCFELQAAVGCGLFPGSNDSNFANCDSEGAYDLQPRRSVVPVLTEKLDNACALSLLYTCRSSPLCLVASAVEQKNIVLHLGYQAIGN